MPKLSTTAQLHHADPQAWVAAEKIRSTSDIPLSTNLIDEVIGQEEAVEVAKKAARQRRHLLLLGDPGTGKSMIAKAMAQLLPPTNLDDVLCLANPKDANVPQVQVVPGGKGRAQLMEAQRRALRKGRTYRVLEWTFALALVGAGIAALLIFGGTASLLVLVLCIMVALFFLYVARQVGGRPERSVPNLLIEHPPGIAPAPYVDATGTHAGGLLGDVRHDPYQSGGLETPTHLRVEPGAIHRAHKGLLFIDEINVLRLDSQQALLTAMQDRRFGITGQSERSSGAQTKTAPVPCDFILVAAGNMDVIARPDQRYTGLHPALRSRIRGYGYEVYVRSLMPDTDENRRKLVRFIAQEIRRDGKIPAFDATAIAEVILEAQRRSGHAGRLTLRLRELGGLVRTAGDIARDEDVTLVNAGHVETAKRLSMSLEHQVTRRAIELHTAPEVQSIRHEEARPGLATAATILGTGETGEVAGVLVPIEATTLPNAGAGPACSLIGAGGDDSELVRAVKANVLRGCGSRLQDRIVHAQAFLRTPGPLEPIGAAIAAASISSALQLRLRQDTVLLGGIATSGRLRRIDAITQMIEAAADAGYRQAIVPTDNKDDVLLGAAYKDRVRVTFAADLQTAIELLRTARENGLDAPRANGKTPRTLRKDLQEPPARLIQDA